MMNDINFKPALCLSTLALVVGCSSGGSGEDSTPIVDPITPPPAQNSSLPQVNFPTLVEGDISESNVDNVISESYRFHNYWLYKLKTELEDIDLERGDSVRPGGNFSGEMDLSEYCVRGGNYSVEAFSDSSMEDANGDPVYGEGDHFEINFAACGANFLNVGYYTSGTHRWEIEAGYFDLYDYLVVGTIVNEVHINRVVQLGTLNLTDLSSFSEFKNGAISYHLLSDTQIRASGERYEEKDINFRYNNPYQISDFSIELSHQPGSWDWDGTYYLSTLSPLTLSSIALNASYQIEVVTALEYTDFNSEYTEGLVRVSGNGSVLEMTYFDTHIAYRLDADGDESFETESIVFYRDL